MKPANRFMSPGIKRQYVSGVAHAYCVRIHMSLILAAVVASGVLTSKGLLELGVHSLRLRYPIAVLASYLVFLLLIRVWIWYVSIRSAANIGFGNLIPDASGSGDGSSGAFGFISSSSEGRVGGGDFSKFGGGSSGGGGGTDSWDTGVAAESISGPPPSSSTGSSWFPKLDFDFDLDDGGWVLILLAVLILAIFGAGGYLVYAAPHILPEAAWQALLATTLTRISKEDHHDWMSGVLRSTCVPFVIVLLLAAALGWEAHRHCPSAPRLIDVFTCPAS